MRAGAIAGRATSKPEFLDLLRRQIMFDVFNYPRHRSSKGGGAVSFYLLGLVVVLLLKTFVHNRGDAEIEWIKRVLEVPADAAILSLMTIVAGGAVASAQKDSLAIWILASVGIVLLSIVLYKYGAKKVTDQGGQISFDNFGIFTVVFLVNVGISIFSLYIVYRLGIF